MLALISIPSYATHNDLYPEYNHFSAAISHPTPIMSGIQMARKTVVGKFINSDHRIFGDGSSSCIGCESNFLKIKHPSQDYTLPAPLKDLFSHKNANERFKNKFIRGKYGYSEVFFFEYHLNSEFWSITEPPSFNAISDTEVPEIFYQKYGDRSLHNVEWVVIY